MCYTAAMQTGLGIMGTMAAQSSAEANAVYQRQAVIKNWNYSMQNAEMERQDAFDSTVRDMEKIRLNSKSLNSSVFAAVNEGLEGGGRTANLLKRSVLGDEARAVSSAQENYQRKSNEIDLNKEAGLISAKSQVDSIQAPSRSSMWLNILGQGLAGYTSFKNAEADALSKGLGFGAWGAKLKSKDTQTSQQDYSDYYKYQQPKYFGYDFNDSYYKGKRYF